MNALEHYKKAEKLLAGAYDMEGTYYPPSDSQVSRATAHLLASISNTLMAQGDQKEQEACSGQVLS